MSLHILHGTPYAAAAGPIGPPYGDTFDSAGVDVGLVDHTPTGPEAGWGNWSFHAAFGYTGIVAGDVAIPGASVPGAREPYLAFTTPPGGQERGVWVMPDLSTADMQADIYVISPEVNANFGFGLRMNTSAITSTGDGDFYFASILSNGNASLRRLWQSARRTIVPVGTYPLWWRIKVVGTTWTVVEMDGTDGTDPGNETGNSDSDTNTDPDFQVGRACGFTVAEQVNRVGHVSRVIVREL